MFCFWNQITQHVKIKGQISGRTHPLRFDAGKYIY